jgi:hypothetical protein
MKSPACRNETLARLYPTRSFSNTDPWRAGDTPIPGLVGWVLRAAVEIDPSAQLEGDLVLGATMKGYGQHRVQGFDFTSGGVAYIPWPSVELTITDRKADNGGESKVTVSFWPVFRSDPPPFGIGSVLFGQDRHDIEEGEPDSYSFPVPYGATEYRVMPVTVSAGEMTVEEVTTAGGTSTVLARWKEDQTTVGSVGLQAGAGGWRPVPTRPGGAIRVSTGSAGDYVTAFWRYDLGALR